MPPCHGHDLVARNQLLGGGPAFFGDALIVLVHDLQRPAQHAALVVDHLRDNLHAILDLGALHHRSGRRLSDAHADQDGIGRQRGSAGDGQSDCGYGYGKSKQFHRGILFPGAAVAWNGTAYF
ncbi:hypothetical protein D3C71_1349890 [compost metagenome]